MKWMNDVGPNAGRSGERQALTVLATALVLGFTAMATARAEPEDATIQAAIRAYEDGDFSGAIERVSPLHEDLDALTAEQARLVKDILVSAHQRRGEDHFRNARIDACLLDFDRVIELLPREEPGHWQRGIAHYYANRFEEGVKQFEVHRTVNPQDVENAVWHFLCNVRLLDGDVAKARAELIPVTRDPRIPMAEIQRLFAGELEPEDVLAAAGDAGLGAKFYADLYVGLWHEAMGNEEKAMLFIARAAKNPSARHYMGDVARTHLLVRNREE